MKKLVYIATLLFVMTSCGAYRGLNLNKLTTGMTKAEVREAVGAPDRVLAINQTEHGYQEILEYRTSRDEVYALEFWNDHLTGYEFLYDDVKYVVPAAPPAWYPEPGRPIVYPVYIEKDKPVKPGNSGRPGNSERPNPVQPEKPKPTTPDRSGLTKPSPTPTTPATRPTTTREVPAERTPR